MSLLIGDTVKTLVNKTPNGNKLYPKGTVCKVKSIYTNTKNNTNLYEIVPVNSSDKCGFYYLEAELEKGKLVWVPVT